MLKTKAKKESQDWTEMVQNLSEEQKDLNKDDDIAVNNCQEEPSLIANIVGELDQLREEKKSPQVSDGAQIVKAGQNTVDERLNKIESELRNVTEALDMIKTYGF